MKQTVIQNNGTIKTTQKVTCQRVIVMGLMAKTTHHN